MSEDTIIYQKTTDNPRKVLFAQEGDTRKSAGRPKAARDSCNKNERTSPPTFGTEIVGDPVQQWDLQLHRKF